MRTASSSSAPAAAQTSARFSRQRRVWSPTEPSTSCWSPGPAGSGPSRRAGRRAHGVAVGPDRVGRAHGGDGLAMVRHAPDCERALPAPLRPGRYLARPCAPGPSSPRWRSPSPCSRSRRPPTRPSPTRRATPRAFSAGSSRCRSTAPAPCPARSRSASSASSPPTTRRARPSSPSPAARARRRSRRDSPSPEPRPRAGHARPARLRPARHRRSGRLRCPALRPPVISTVDAAARVRTGARRRARPLPHGRLGRRPRGAARRVGLRQARARRRLLRDQGRARLRGQVPRHVESLVLDSVVPPEGTDPLNARCRPCRARWPSLRRRRVQAHHHERRRRCRASCADGRAQAAQRDGQHAPAGLTVRLTRTASSTSCWPATSTRRCAPSCRARCTARCARTTGRCCACSPRAAGLTGVPDAPRACARSARRDSDALFAATRCEETAFPWDRDAGPSRAPRQACRPPGRCRAPTARFTYRVALTSEAIPLCVGWPVASPAPAPPAPLPAAADADPRRRLRRAHARRRRRQSSPPGSRAPARPGALRRALGASAATSRPARRARSTASSAAGRPPMRPRRPVFTPTASRRPA